MPKEFGNLSYADYTPQYVGQDVEGIKAISQKADQDYNTNLANKDAMDLAINELYSKVRGQNAPLVKSAYDKAQNELKSIQDSGNWENAQYKLQKVAKDFALNNDIKGALTDKQAYDSWLKDLNERVNKKPEEGGITTQQRDEAVKMSLTNPNNNKQAIFNPKTLAFENQFKGYSPVKYRDIGTRMFDLAKGWKADETPFLVANSKGKEEMAKYIPSLGGYYTTVSHERVNDGEVSKSLRQAIMANPEDLAYIQEQEKFHKENKFKNPDGTYRDANDNDIQSLGFNKDKLKENGIDIDTLSSKEKTSLYDNILRNKTLDSYVEPATNKESYDKIQAKYVKDWISEVYLKHKLAKSAEEDSLGIPQTSNTNKQINDNITDALKGTPLEGLSKEDFQDTGDLKASYTNSNIGYGGYPLDPNKQIGKIGESEFDMETNKKRVNFITKLQQDNPSLQRLKPSQVFDAYVEARKNSEQQSKKEYSIEGLNTKKITENVINNLDGKSINVDGKGDGTLKGALDELGLSNKDQIKEALLKAKTNSILPVGGKFKFQIYDKEGKPREVSIDGSNEQRSFYQAPTKMTELENKGETGEGTFYAVNPVKVNQNKGRIDDSTKDLYGYKTFIAPDPNTGEMVYQTKGGKLFSEKDTKAFMEYKIKELGKEEAKKYFENRVFIDNKLAEDKTPDELMQESHAEWMRSGYNKPFRTKSEKNPIEFDNLQDNIEE